MEGSPMIEEKTIVIIEDDFETGALIKEFLERYYTIKHYQNGPEALTYLKANPSTALVIMDILLPGMDGYEICRQIRTDRNTAHVPIIMLTAMEEETDRVIGLELGADDYISKPFSLRELLARMRSIIRRAEIFNTQPADPCMRSKLPILKFANWSLDTASRRLFFNNTEVSLTSKSYALLLAFLKNPQRVLSRDQLLDIISNRSAEPFDRSIDIQVSRLRQKIEVDPAHPIFIKTIRNGGYMFTATVSET
jgi:two-component system, OmpR family, response regulator